MEKILSLPGVALLYGVMCGIAFITMYCVMPETEGRSLEDIERHFSNDSKKITDWKIAKSRAAILDFHDEFSLAIRRKDSVKGLTNVQ